MTLSEFVRQYFLCEAPISSFVYDRAKSVMRLDVVLFNRLQKTFQKGEPNFLNVRFEFQDVDYYAYNGPRVDKGTIVVYKALMEGSGRMRLILFDRLQWRIQEMSIGARNVQTTVLEPELA